MRIFQKRQAAGTGFERPEGMSEALHRLLVQRGISSVEEARAFLRPTKSMLHPPERLPGVEQAAAMLREAIGGGKRICIYGDYDVDGVSASSILYLTLKRMNAQVQVYLPSRQEEGYGLNEEAVRKLAGECDLLITVDCGISSVELVALARQLGLTVIVTDHHRPGEILPDCPLVNPLVGDYPDPYLCGAGVAFKLSQALLGMDEALEFVDLAALATVADIVSLTGENRVIVKLGLDRMNRAPRLGLACLRDVAGMGDKPFTSGLLGFQIGPRLNASGRLGSARRAFDLLTGDDPSRVRALAVELNAENALRKQIEEEISHAAAEQMRDFDFQEHRAIVLGGEGWNSGVIGLAASRLTERYHFPTILISMNGDVGVGSCRSIPGVDIYKALSAAGEHLVKFGGHAQAAGLTIQREELPGFIRVLDAYLRETVSGDVYIPVTEYDIEAQFSELDMGFVAMMEAFAPTGMGNPAPVFFSRARVAEARQVGKDGAHLSLRLTDGTNYMKAVAFREGPRLGQLARELDVAYSPKINEFNGRSSVDLEIKAMEDAPGDLTERANNDPDVRIAAFLTDVLYNKGNTFPTKRAVSRDEMQNALDASPQGTLVVAADAEAAKGFRNADVLIGSYPDDPRCFNAVCVQPAGVIPGGYSRVFYAGLPRGDYLEGKKADWLDRLPGLAELRQGYTAVRRMLSRPVRCAGLAEYARSLEDECGLDGVCLTACVLIFLELGLVEDRGGFHLKMGEFRKLDPATSRAYRICQELRGGAACE